MNIKGDFQICISVPLSFFLENNLITQNKPDLNIAVLVKNNYWQLLMEFRDFLLRYLN